MIGAGKYDELATMVREKSHARSVIIIVMGGDKGDGFACQTDMETFLALPGPLATCRNQLRATFVARTPIFGPVQAISNQSTL